MFPTSHLRKNSPNSTPSKEFIVLRDQFVAKHGYPAFYQIIGILMGAGRIESVRLRNSPDIKGYLIRLDCNHYNPHIYHMVSQLEDQGIFSKGYRESAFPRLTIDKSTQSIVPVRRRLNFSLLYQNEIFYYLFYHGYVLGLKGRKSFPPYFKHLVDGPMLLNWLRTSGGILSESGHLMGGPMLTNWLRTSGGALYESGEPVKIGLILIPIASEARSQALNIIVNVFNDHYLTSDREVQPNYRKGRIEISNAYSVYTSVAPYLVVDSKDKYVNPTVLFPENVFTLDPRINLKNPKGR